jgi:chemotaxis protein MotB
LVAAGFGEFQPLDSAATEDAYKRNRRIELKLTER